MIIGGISIQGNQLLVRLERTSLKLLDIEDESIVYENQAFPFLPSNELAIEEEQEEIILALVARGFATQTHKKIDLNGTRYHVIQVI